MNKAGAPVRTCAKRTILVTLMKFLIVKEELLVRWVQVAVGHAAALEGYARGRVAAPRRASAE